MPPAPQNPWYEEGLQFACTRCGRCCGGAPGYVWISAAEANEIAEFLDLPLDRFMKQHTRRVRSRRSLNEYEDGDCEFLERNDDGTAGCSIHAVRPIQCRTWPFWKSNLRSRKSWDATADWCPGMNAGPHHPLPVINAALAENDDANLDL